MLAEQLYGGDANLDFDTISAQITAIEAVILVVLRAFLLQLVINVFDLVLIVVICLV